MWLNWLMTASWRTAAAICFLAVNSARAITDADRVFEFCPGWDSIKSGTAVLVAYEREWREQRHVTDCIHVTLDGRIAISRLLPELRRMYRVQELRADGQYQKPVVGRLPSPITREGIAIDQDGTVVYLASALPHSVLLFDRDKETGLLRFRELRQFGSEAERENSSV